MKPKGSLPHSQFPATWHYPEPARSSPYPHIPSRRSICTFSVSYVAQEYQSRSEAFFVNVLQQDTFLQWGVVSTWPNPQDGGPPLVCCPRLLIQYIRSYPPYWKLFLLPQHEDASCRGDRDPLITDYYGLLRIYRWLSSSLFRNVSGVTPRLQWRHQTLLCYYVQIIISYCEIRIAVSRFIVNVAGPRWHIIVTTRLMNVARTRDNVFVHSRQNLHRPDW